MRPHRLPKRVGSKREPLIVAERRRSAFVFVITLVPGLAWAGPPIVEGPGQDPSIYGGQPTQECQWPTTVSMAGNCTGSLVHPEIVIYAGHCGPVPWVFFGEDISNMAAGRTVETEYCEVNPAYLQQGIGAGVDFAFCKLVEPVLDPAPVPILMGCETELLQVGQEVVAVGFGFDEFEAYGVKRHVTFPIVTVGDEVEAGGNGLSICNGDSGGPLFLRLPVELDPDESWRVFGVTSYGPADCALPQWFGTMHRAVEWIEMRSGIDITPCHNADGSWQAGPDCTAFPIDHELASGSWADACGPFQTTGKSATCGDPALDADIEAPVVAITAPLEGAVFERDPETMLAPIDIVAEASDAGWGVASVELRVDGQPIPNGVRLAPPWSWSGSFPQGSYVVDVVATDLAGNLAESAPVGFGVDAEPPEPEPSETGDESESESGSSDEVGDAGGTEESGAGPSSASDDGCGCTSSSPRSAGWLFVVVLLGLRRSRQGVE